VEGNLRYEEAGPGRLMLCMNLACSSEERDFLPMMIHKVLINKRGKQTNQSSTILREKKKVQHAMTCKDTSFFAVAVNGRTLLASACATASASAFAPAPYLPSLA